MFLIVNNLPHVRLLVINVCFVYIIGKAELYQVILKKIELPIVPHYDCEKSLRTTRLGAYFKLHDSFTCAGGEDGRDTCTVISSV